MAFSEIYGNRRVKEQLREAALSGRAPHALILAGRKGSGRSMLASAFLEALLCPNRTGEGEPCGQCPVCVKLREGCHPDVITLQPDKPELISVDDIRGQINDTAGVRPWESAYKVYIIPGAERMNVQAQNALLKTLEEPPDYVMMILMTEDLSLMLPTVQSRALKLKTEALSRAELEALLDERHPGEEEGRALALSFADGCGGRALELCGDAEFAALCGKLVALLKELPRLDFGEITMRVRELLAYGRDPQELLALMGRWYRDILVLRCTGSVEELSFRGEKRALLELAETIDGDSIGSAMKEIEKCQCRMEARAGDEACLRYLCLCLKEI